MSNSEKVEKYKDLLVNLLPKGRLWSVKNQPTFEKLILSVSEELCRIDDRITKLLNEEIDPRTADETLDVWESIFGIPDECSTLDETVPERRVQLTQKMTNVGGLSKSYYEGLILSLGFESTVENRINFVAGRGKAGDLLTNYFNRHFVAGSLAGGFLTEVGWLFYFNAELPITASEIFVAGSLAGDPLRSFSNPLIECTLKKHKPAYAGLTFTFKE